MVKKENDILIGAHLSTSGGFEKAIYAAEELNIPCVQIFTKSNRQWKCKDITEEEAAIFTKTFQESHIVSHIVAHASYLINCASSKASLWEQSVTALEIELQRCHTLNIPTLVLHPGSANGHESPQQGINQIKKALERALNKTHRYAITIALETMAGQGSSIGKTFEELAAICTDFKTDRLTICLDTCHLFSAGYPIHTPEGYKETIVQLDTILGLEKVSVIHMNDSKKAFNSHVDRHDHIGQGLIGAEAFKRIILDKHFVHIPKILETPKETDLIAEKRNITVLRKLIAT